MSPRKAGYLPGRGLESGWRLRRRALLSIDVFNDFTDENIRQFREAARRGRRPATSPLFNGHLDDGHFSPLGCALWGRVVARRITLLLDPQSLAARKRSVASVRGRNADLGRHSSALPKRDERLRG